VLKIYLKPSQPFRIITIACIDTVLIGAIISIRFNGISYIHGKLIRLLREKLKKMIVHVTKNKNNLYLYAVLEFLIMRTKSINFSII
jgi:hypothetical protein